VESNWVHSALRPPMAYYADPGWLWCWRNWWNDWQGKPKYSEKTCSSASSSTINPTCCPDANPGRCGGKPATNRLSYGSALKMCYSTRIQLFILVYVRLRNLPENKNMASFCSFCLADLRFLAKWYDYPLLIFSLISSLRRFTPSLQFPFSCIYYF
jgi:hypothetical protein